MRPGLGKSLPSDLQKKHLTGTELSLPAQTDHLPYAHSHHFGPVVPSAGVYKALQRREGLLLETLVDSE
ncbi:UNVERIFIED_CONTAM: hypothetical protein K2H54_010804 [Gekko kuhli]